ncbi:hypothetical protein [Ostreiculturibacter nitratireducens]|uniref:hypothetical protein n=1 Tax=Ostreiculturibacter nitratireducens TaxID=3075226 RepID=UPI0031B59EC6
MKTLIAAITASMIAMPALAGGMAEPVIEPVIAPEVIEEDTAGTSGGIIVPLLLLVLIAVAVHGHDSGSSTPVDTAPAG